MNEKKFALGCIEESSPPRDAYREKKEILDLNVLLKFDRGLSFRFDSGVVSRSISCSIHGV